MDTKREAYLKETKEHFFYPWQKDSQLSAPGAAEKKFPGKTVEDSIKRTNYIKTYISTLAI